MLPDEADDILQQQIEITAELIKQAAKIKEADATQSEKEE